MSGAEERRVTEQVKRQQLVLSSRGGLMLSCTTCRARYEVLYFLESICVIIFSGEGMLLWRNSIVCVKFPVS